MNAIVVATAAATASPPVPAKNPKLIAELHKAIDNFGTERRRREEMKIELENFKKLVDEVCEANMLNDKGNAG